MADFLKKINILTRAQYDLIEPNIDELYIISDDLKPILNILIGEDLFTAESDGSVVLTGLPRTGAANVFTAVNTFELPLKVASAAEDDEAASLGQLKEYAISASPSTEKTTSCSLSLVDRGKLLLVNHATDPIEITIPLFASVAFPVDTEIAVFRLGQGTVTIKWQEGVLVNGKDFTNSFLIAAQYGSVCLRKIAENTWLISGGI